MRHLYLTPPLKVLLSEFCIAVRAKKNYNDGSKSKGELTKLMLFRHNTRVLRRTDRKTDRIPIAISHISVFGAPLTMIPSEFCQFCSEVYHQDKHTNGPTRW